MTPPMDNTDPAEHLREALEYWSALPEVWPRPTRVGVESVAVTEVAANDLIDLEGDLYGDPGHGDPGHNCTHPYELTMVGDDEDRPGEYDGEFYRLFISDTPGVIVFPVGHRVRRVNGVPIKFTDAAPVTGDSGCTCQDDPQCPAPWH